MPHRTETRKSVHNAFWRQRRQKNKQTWRSPWWKRSFVLRHCWHFKKLVPESGNIFCSICDGDEGSKLMCALRSLTTTLLCHKPKNLQGVMSYFSTTRNPFSALRSCTTRRNLRYTKSVSSHAVLNSSTVERGSLQTDLLTCASASYSEVPSSNLDLPSSYPERGFTWFF
jgi:hypothetical protein